MYKFKIGTDCSGIEAPIQALKKLNVNFSHEWSCEIDKYARESILANYDPKVIYEDITIKRNLPKIDIYVSGFPCQSFSIAGNRGGFDDTRGTIFYYCLKTIKQSQPNIFILENVKGILSHDSGNTWNIILNNLDSLKTIYNIDYMILNTLDYGIPQNRERVFIVGIKKNIQKNKFVFPKKLKMKNIHDYIDYNDNSKQSIPPFAKNAVSKSKGVFLDLSWIRKVSKDSYSTYSPTICTNGALWCKPMKRRANIYEYLKLQGFPINFKQVVSDTQMKKQIGNSMSVNVLVELFKEIFKAIDIKL